MSNVEFNTLTFVKCFETVALDSAEMYEYISSAVYRNETITFF